MAYLDARLLFLQVIVNSHSNQGNKNMITAPIVISSAYLAEELRHIDFDSKRVEKAILEHDRMILVTNLDDIEVLCEVSSTGNFKQEDVRWDLIKQLVDEISEQPITIYLGDNYSKIVLGY